MVADQLSNEAIDLGGWEGLKRSVRSHSWLSRQCLRGSYICFELSVFEESPAKLHNTATSQAPLALNQPRYAHATKEILTDN